MITKSKFDLDAKVTAEISYSHNLFFKNTLSSKNIKIDDNLFIIGNIKRPALTYFESFIKNERVAINPRGTYFLYKYKNERRREELWGAFNSVRRFLTAVRIYKQTRCAYDAEMAIENILRRQYYPPMSFKYQFDTYDYKKRSIIETRPELNQIKKIYKKLDQVEISKVVHYSKLYNAIEFYNHAYDEPWLFLKTTFIFTALESLFSDSTHSEITYKVAVRAAYFLYPNNPISRKKVFNFVKSAYDIRSRFIHGSDVKTQTEKMMMKIKNQKGVAEYSFMFEFPEELNDLLSKCLIKALLNENAFNFFNKSSYSPKEESGFYENIVLS